jgi:hypothetical protein
MLAIRRWFPGDAQVIQLLINRGYLDDAQVEFARAYQVLDGGDSLLEVAIARGYVDRATIKRVLAEAREDEIVRGLIRRYGLFAESQLNTVRRLQRGTKRSLLTTLVEEGLCPPALKAHITAVPKGWHEVA